MEINPSGLSNLRAIGVPVTRKDNARPTTPEPATKQAPDNQGVALVRAGSEPVFQQADTFRQGPSANMASGQKERLAIEAYESIAKDQQRQNIQQLLGVDTFV